jgi:Tfp pilus assembly protein PilX
MRVRQRQRGFGLMSVLIAAGLSALVVLSVLQLVNDSIRQVVAANYRSQAIMLALSAEDLQRHCQQACYATWQQQVEHSLPRAGGSWHCNADHGEVTLHWYHDGQQQFQIRSSCRAARQ